MKITETTTDMKTDKSPLSITENESTITIKLPSTLKNIDLTSNEMKLFLSKMEITDSADVFAIDLVMREGMTNAVRHGSKGNPDKIIKFTLEYKNKTLVMEIEDEGDGFNWQNQKNNEANIEDDHGRGFSIMQEFFTEYKYNEKGNKLTLIKLLN